jgi:predicted RNA binding protein YcfA (HicA-like mRNA interferase family)
MKPAELLRCLRRTARRNGWDFSESEGGNHTKVTLNGRRTVISRHADHLKTGTYRGILKQLGLTETELEK